MGKVEKTPLLHFPILLFPLIPFLVTFLPLLLSSLSSNFSFLSRTSLFQGSLPSFFIQRVCVCLMENFCGNQDTKEQWHNMQKLACPVVTKIKHNQRRIVGRMKGRWRMKWNSNNSSGKRTEMGGRTHYKSLYYGINTLCLSCTLVVSHFVLLCPLFKPHTCTQAAPIHSKHGTKREAHTNTCKPNDTCMRSPSHLYSHIKWHIRSIKIDSKTDK